MKTPNEVIKWWQAQIWKGVPVDPPYTAGDLLTLQLDLRADGRLEEFFEDIDKTTGDPS